MASRTSGTVVAFILTLSAGVVLASSPAVAQPAETTGTTTSSATTIEGGTNRDVETTTVQALPPAPPPAPEEIPKLDERTAFMVGKGKLKLGILAFEYGILRNLSVGSDPPAWAARAVMKIWVPNAHIKYQILDRDPIWLAVQGSGYFAWLNKDGVSGELFNIPLSLFATVKVHPRVHLHGEGTYLFARVSGTGDITRAEFNGVAPLRAGQLGLMAQFRITRIVSLTATGRYQVYAADVPFSGTGSIDAFTTATVNGQLVPGVKHPWEAIAGVAVLWKHFHMILGAGYGYYFVPGLDLPNTTKTFVPDASLAVVL